MKQTSYPGKSRSAAVDRTMPGKSRSAGVDEVTRGVGKPSMHGGMKSGHKVKKGALRGRGKN